MFYVSNRRDVCPVSFDRQDRGGGIYEELREFEPLMGYWQHTVEGQEKRPPVSKKNRTGETSPCLKEGGFLAELLIKEDIFLPCFVV